MALRYRRNTLEFFHPRSGSQVVYLQTVAHWLYIIQLNPLKGYHLHGRGGIALYILQSLNEIQVQRIVSLYPI